jgi:hypothetical protein
MRWLFWGLGCGISVSIDDTPVWDGPTLKSCLTESVYTVIL